MAPPRNPAVLDWNVLDSQQQQQQQRQQQQQFSSRSTHAGGVVHTLTVLLHKPICKVQARVHNTQQATAFSTSNVMSYTWPSMDTTNQSVSQSVNQSVIDHHQSPFDTDCRIDKLSRAFIGRSNACTIIATLVVRNCAIFKRRACKVLHRNTGALAIGSIVRDDAIDKPRLGIRLDRSTTTGRRCVVVLDLRVLEHYLCFVRAVDATTSTA
jgi:hypothetical protein